MKYLLFITIIFLGLLYATDVQAGIIFKPVFHTGLVGYWDFQEGAGSKAYDKSGNENHGTLENMATSSNGGWTDGKLGSGLNFDGDDDHIEIANESNFDFELTDSFSVSMWLKPDTGDTTIQIPVSKNADDALKGWDIVTNLGSAGDAGKINVQIISIWDSNVLAVYTTNDTNLNDGGWHHYVMTYDGTTGPSGVKIYEDSVSLALSIDRNSLGATILNDEPLTIGSRKDGGVTWHQLYNGIIDQVRIYNRALSAGEVERLYKLSQPTVAAPTMTGLVGYWAFEEGKGTKARDSSFNTNHGDLTNMEEADWVDGKLGTALDFDGSDEYVNCGSDSSLDDLPAFTYSLWIYPTGWGEDNEGALIHKQSSEKELRLMNGSSEESLRMYIRGGGGGTTAETNASNGSISLNEWQHIVMTFDLNGDAKARLYKNGVELSYALQLAGAAPLEPDAAGNLLIGKGNSTARRFDGIIDEVRIYNRVLSTSEIEALYKSGLAKINASQNDKITDGLVGLWSFNGPDMDGDDAFDRSGQGNHGTLVNGPVPTIGKVGQALEFDGDNDYVDVPYHSSLDFGTGDFTISVWFKPAALPGGGHTLVGKPYYETTGYMLRQDDADCHFFICGGGQLIQASSVFTVGEWAHGVVTRNGTNVSMYVDGSLKDSDTSSCDITESEALNIGMYQDGNMWPINGTIDEVRIYNRALSAQEIQRLYNMGR